MIKIIQGNCIEIVPNLTEEFDMIFSDPPFNLAKDYKSKINDKLTEAEYLEFQNNWILECSKKLKEGGSFFIFNIPKWNIEASHYMRSIGLEFRHWIAIDMTLGLPIRNRLYPSHYSLIYFTKGKPKTFNQIRIPIEQCRHCSKDIKDYGGHRDKIHPDGTNLKDIWTDIGKVTGKKNREANELPIKLLDRVIRLSTNPGDLILDPFAGSGTTLKVAQDLERFCVGIEMDDCEDIKKRLVA